MPLLLPAIDRCHISHPSELRHPGVVDQHLRLLKVLPIGIDLIRQNKSKLVRLRAILGELTGVPRAGGSLLQKSSDFVPRPVSHKMIGAPLGVGTAGWHEAPGVKPDLRT